MITISNLCKTYNEGKTNAFTALKNINLTINSGESVAIIGQSGAGKSTLLNILRAQLSATDGIVRVDNVEITDKKFSEVSDYIRNKIASIYQDYFLVEELSVYDNIELPLCISKMKKRQRREKCIEVIKRVGLETMFKKKVSQLSGGEKQRVAIARSIVTGAKYIFADEPTGALDTVNSKNIMDMLYELNAEGKTLVYVTHELTLASRAKRIITIGDGAIISDVINP